MRKLRFEVLELRTLLSVTPSGGFDFVSEDVVYDSFDLGPGDNAYELRTSASEFIDSGIQSLATTEVKIEVMDIISEIELTDIKIELFAKSIVGGWTSATTGVTHTIELAVVEINISGDADEITALTIDVSSKSIQAGNGGSVVWANLGPLYTWFEGGVDVSIIVSSGRFGSDAAIQELGLDASMQLNSASVIVQGSADRWGLHDMSYLPGFRVGHNSLMHAERRMSSIFQEFAGLAGTGVFEISAVSKTHFSLASYGGIDGAYERDTNWATLKGEVTHGSSEINPVVIWGGTTREQVVVADVVNSAVSVGTFLKNDVHNVSTAIGVSYHILTISAEELIEDELRFVTRW